MSAAAQQADNERDAHVVEEILGYITSSPARSFFLFAGAGSGKTRTLVEVLRRVTGSRSTQPVRPMQSVYALVANRFVSSRTPRTRLPL